MLGWGMYIGSRRELIWTLRQRAERAEAEQELRVAQARGNERARIAREMHDVLAHRISQISMHAGALAFREDLDRRGDARAAPRSSGSRPTRRSPTCAACSACSATRAPASSLDRRSRRTPTCRALVAEARGVRARASSTATSLPTTTPVPDAVGRTVYRIVQEGITNARKHAPGAALHHRGQRLTRTTASTSCCATRSASARRATPGAGLGPGRAVRARRAARRAARARPRRRRRSCCTAGYRGRHDRPATRVLIVDDDPLVRSALALMLGGQADIDVVGEAGDGREGVDLARRAATPTSC